MGSSKHALHVLYLTKWNEYIQSGNGKFHRNALHISLLILFELLKAPQIYVVPYSVRRTRIDLIGLFKTTQTRWTQFRIAQSRDINAKVEGATKRHQMATSAWRQEQKTLKDNGVVPLKAYLKYSFRLAAILRWLRSRWVKEFCKLELKSPESDLCVYWHTLSTVSDRFVRVLRSNKKALIPIWASRYIPQWR